MSKVAERYTTPRDAKTAIADFQAKKHISVRDLDGAEYTRFIEGIENKTWSAQVKLGYQTTIDKIKERATFRQVDKALPSKKLTYFATGLTFLAVGIFLYKFLHRKRPSNPRS